MLVSTHISQVVAIAALHSFVYWLDERTERTGVERISYTGDGRKPEVQRLRNITDIVAVWTPDVRVLRNHSCTVHRAKCSHLCVLDTRTGSGAAQCACPPGMSLLDDGHNCGAPPICGPDHFTCSASDNGGNSDRSGISRLGSGGGGLGASASAAAAAASDQNKDCIPVSWRCDGQNDCADKSDEMGCPKCAEDQFKCQSGECIDRAFVCDGTTNCADGYDEADCCKNMQDFQCPINKVCIPATYLCDGWDHCADGADEAADMCLTTQNNGPNRKGPGGGIGGIGVGGNGAASGSDKETFIVVSVVVMVVIFAVVFVVNTRLNGCKAGFRPGGGLEPKDDPANDPLSPHCNGSAAPPRVLAMNATGTDAMRMTNVRRGQPAGNTATNVANSYDRNHITGASSSTTTTNHSNSFNGYPYNPPPSPATTTASTARYNSFQPYRNYLAINQPPPPTPCQTDVCDESDSVYTPTRSMGRMSAGSFHQQQHHHRSGKQRYRAPSASSAYSVMHAPASPNGGDLMMDREPFPPPPTPGSSHYHSDFGGEYGAIGGGGGGGSTNSGRHARHMAHDQQSCPPSPGSRSSTYFAPLPPPPSPVPTGPSSRTGSGSGYS